MFAIRRRRFQSARPFVSCRSLRSYSAGPHGDSGHGHGHNHDHDHDHDHHHAAPVEEPLGTGFWFLLSLAPISYVVYIFSRPAEDGSPANPLSKALNYYSDMNEKWMERTVLHTNMVEQAAFDRNLFQGTARVKHVNLRFQEIFNTGSPLNVAAGQGYANLDKLVAHYEKLNEEQDEKWRKNMEARRAKQAKSA